ncbi:MAG: tRNA dihydrouridine synthase DusB [Anaerovibrio sp.]|uniref:tRNA dihydrouridine synthase DusB n=1 Tax=Anaerovibrio sp. TaxID=1872532 RepID=UPI00260CBA4C|nr:tRNA dihydrouridine synthase DusB [Anaerovibrio sp.]MDD7676885.1 tRNA dihydrouridine synthase DusB [Anaerovibrio sp.]MDY2602853.1 tRNA dihydrouridine synthase DusB [Anaerovibrio sp.]
MRIGDFEFAYPVFLAPMAGVTDTPYRILAREMGCPLVYSEMVSDKGINYRNEHTLNMLKTEPEERPMAMQLFGAEADSVAKAAEYVASLGCADILDFNMGCPAPKVVKNHEGSAMLKNPENAYRVLKALVGAVDMPVTVKLRIGWDDQHINIMEMAQLAQEAGVAAIAIHGRTREQFYRDQADWQIIGRVRESLRIPVIANGDVRNVQDMIKIRQVTGCEAVMVGRAAQGNPWIFRQLTEYLRSGAVLPGPTMDERKEVIIRHLDMLLKFKGDYIGPREMRKHATWYTKGIKGSAELRCLFNQAVCRDDFLRILDKMK